MERPSEIEPRAADRAVEAGRGALFIGFAKAYFMVAGFLQRWLLTHLVGLAEYGAFSLVNGVVSTVNNTVVQGTIQSVSKFTAEDDARADAVKRAGLRLQAFVGVAIGLGFFLAAPLVAELANAPGYVPYFRLVAVIPLLYAFYSVFVGSANGLRRFHVQAAFDVGFSTAKTVLLLGGAFVGRAAGQPVAGAFLGFAGAAALILIVAAGVMGLPKGRERFDVTRLLVFMGGVVVYTLLINLALNYDLILLRRFAGAALHDSRSADALAGNYEALRNVALLPYQALLVLTFVIFPLVSRSTFANDREATRAYVTQTLRYALIIGTAMAVVVAGSPTVVLALLYRPEYHLGAPALPILAAGIVGLALLSISGSIFNASGRPRVAVGLIASALAAGAALNATLVPAAAPGAPMLVATAMAGASGVAVGLAVALVTLWRRFGAGLPAATLVRVAVAAALAVGTARLFPSAGKLVGLGVLASAGVVYFAALIVLRELGPTELAKLRKILRRRAV